MIFLLLLIDESYFVPDQYELPLKAGRYKFECFGAQGGEGHDNGAIHSVGGKGAYVYGELPIKGKGTTFIIRVGGKGTSGKNGPNPGGFNGGGSSGKDVTASGNLGDASGGGGGASDIRTSPSINDRIMVAAGGSGGAGYANGAPGGALSGRKIGCNNCHYNIFNWDYKCDSYPEFDSDKTTQISGNAILGSGGNGENTHTVPGSGGGGGWQGGMSSGESSGGTDCYHKSIADSGSSYISGYPNCKPSTVNDYRFENSGMQIGQHEGNGKVVITTIYKCKDNCASCSSNDNCFECLEPFKLYNNNCYETCPDGTSESGSICEDCKDSHCFKCPSSANVCDKCYDPFFLLNENGVTSCVDKCIDGKIGIDGKCVDCNQKCSTCSLSVDYCDSCQGNNYLFNGDCYSECNVLNDESKSEYYGKDINNKKCLKCTDDKCIDCSNNFEECDKCIDSFYVDEKTHKCVKIPSHVFTYSQVFTSSDLFTNSEHFTKSDCFASSNYFSNSAQFTESDQFSKTNQFTGTEQFSSTNHFSNSASFSNSAQFSSSAQFTNSNIFSNSAQYTDFFTKTDLFSRSNQFSSSFDFTNSKGFTNSVQFSSSNKFSNSDKFTVTGLFSYSNDFSYSDHFSISSYFTNSAKFSYSNHFTSSSQYTHSQYFTNTQHFTNTEQFTSTHYFSSTEHFTNSHEFSPSFVFDDPTKYSCLVSDSNKNFILYERCFFSGLDTNQVDISLIRTHFENFINESDGGAIYILNSAIHFNHSEFINCVSSNGCGGAIYINNSKEIQNDIVFKNITFTNCKATFGGAVAIFSLSDLSNISVSYCNFYSNRVIEKNSNKNSDFNGGSAAFLCAKNMFIYECAFAQNKGSRGALKIYNHFNNDKTKMKKLRYLENNQKSIIVSNCNFDDSKSSIYNANERHQSMIDIINCNFNDKLDKMSDYIEGKEMDLDSSKVSIKSFTFQKVSTNLKTTFSIAIFTLAAIFAVVAFVIQKVNNINNRV